MKKNNLFFLLLIFCFPSFATETISNPLTIAPYYQANCGLVTGTWQGFFTDPTDLYGDGGPWAISMSLLNQNGKIIGKADANNAPAYVGPAVNKRIWADCTNGVLTNIFIGNRDTCGAYSKGGELVSKNLLILFLHTESAMNGTDFLVVLRRVNDQYAFPMPTNADDFNLGTIKTCH